MGKDITKRAITACKQYCLAAGATQGNIAYTQTVSGKRIQQHFQLKNDKLYLLTHSIIMIKLFKKLKCLINKGNYTGDCPNCDEYYLDDEEVCQICGWPYTN